jgi:hypothetical protein
MKNLRKVRAVESEQRAGGRKAEGTPLDGKIRAAHDPGSLLAAFRSLFAQSIDFTALTTCSAVGL